jgi:hypothetical protein
MAARSTFRARAARSLFALCFASASARALALQKPIEIPPLFAGEGALENDSFLPSAAAPAKKIAEGDRAFVKARASGTGAYEQALDAWHEALRISALDDTLAEDADLAAILGALLPDPDHTRTRRSESIECAVVRRVRAIDPRVGDAWRARFDALAADDLAAAGADETRLARVAHDHPLTHAAARACLELFDLEFEKAELSLARAWLARASEAARATAPPDAAFAAAIERRASALRAVANMRSDGARDGEAWQRAEHVHLVTRVALGRDTTGGDRIHAPRTRSGIARMDGDATIVQNADVVYAIGASGSVRRIDLASAAAELTLTFAPTFSDPQSNIRASPASDGEHLVVVAGRGLASRGNALLCFARGASSGDLVPMWGYGDQAARVTGDAAKSFDEMLEPGVWEFEAGAALFGDLVLVHARQWTSDGARAAAVDEGHVRAWCLAFDRATGAVRWKRWLAGGAVLASAGARGPGEARGAATSSADLGLSRWSERADGGAASGLFAEHVFISTELGVGVLLDAADGTLEWSLRNRRRASDGLARAGVAPLLTSACGETRTSEWLWAPGDSDALYRVRDGADRDGRGVLAQAPRRLRPADVVLGGDACGCVGFDPSPLERSVWSDDEKSGARASSLSIAREESAPAAVLLSPARIAFATDRALYVCDRTRELALVDRVPLVDVGRREQPALIARGDRLYVADSSTLWILSVE